jgi:hypothetical protein
MNPRTSDSKSKAPEKAKKELSASRLKAESVDRLKNQLEQAKLDGNHKLIAMLRAILKRLGERHD